MVLRIDNLTKKYGSHAALDSVSLTLTEGIYGLLGPNGAGKSTLINLITDNIKRSSGNIYFDETDILKLGGKFREKVGYMPQQQGYYDDFTAINFMKYMAGMKGIPIKQAKIQSEELLASVNLANVAHHKIGSFSGGMKQRVMLAQALLGNPKILILDEPTAGLDPSERVNIRNLIRGFGEGKIIIYATHVVSDIEGIADRIIFLKGGHIIKDGTPAELIESISGKVAEIGCKYEDISKYQKDYVTGKLYRRKQGNYLRIIKNASDNEFPADANLVDNEIDLEDVYLYYLVR